MERLKYRPHLEDKTMELSKGKIVAIDALFRTAEEDDKPLLHPIATLNMLCMLEPDLEIVKEVYPWVKEHENDGLKLKDILNQLRLILSQKASEEKESNGK